MKAIKNSRY